MTKKKEHDTEPAEADQVDAALQCVIDDLDKELRTGTRGAKMKATEAGARFNPIDMLPFIKSALELWRQLRGEKAAE